MSRAREAWDELGIHFSSIVQAWEVRAVRRGFYGTLMITAGSLSPAYLPANSPLMRPLRWAHLTGAPMRILGTVLTLAGLFLLVDAWFQMRPTRRKGEVVAWHQIKHWAVLAWWGAPFVLAPPIFSHDAYSYAAQGWLVHNGTNPYQAGPGTLPGAFADQVAWVWRYTPAPYGPLSLQIQHGLVHLANFDPYVSAVMMRLPALVGVVLIGLLIPRIAVKLDADPAMAAWFATLSPVLVIDYIGGAHNDALMIGLCVLALWLAFEGPWQWLLGAAIVGVAAAIKQPALLAAYALPLVARPWVGWRPREVVIAVSRAVVSVGVSVACFAGITQLTGLGWGWIDAMSVPGMVVTVSPSSLLGQAGQFLLDATGMDPSHTLAVRGFRWLGLAVAAGVIAVGSLTVARRRPVDFLALGWIAFALGSPALQSWYVLWGGVLLPLTHVSRKLQRIAVWTTVVLLSYAAISLAWRNSVSSVHGNNGMVALGVVAVAGLWWMVRTRYLATGAAHRGASHGKEVGRG